MTDWMIAITAEFLGGAMKWVCLPAYRSWLPNVDHWFDAVIASYVIAYLDGPDLVLA
jgi:hypothetical protein